MRRRRRGRSIPWDSTLAGFEPSNCEFAISRREADEYATVTREWLDSLEVPWDWFVTLTYDAGRDRVSFEKASRDFLQWAREVERAALPAKEARKVGIRWARAIERHKDGVPHIHALMADCPNLNARLLRALWMRGSVEAKPFDPDRESVRYLLKDIERGAHFALSPCFAKRMV